MARTREHYETCYRVYHAEADLAYSLDVFGDQLAEQNGLPPDLYGIDAVNFYLIKKHNWTPTQVREMSAEDKRLALSEEMQKFKMPKNAILKQD